MLNQYVSIATLTIDRRFSTFGSDGACLSCVRIGGETSGASLVRLLPVSILYSQVSLMPPGLARKRLWNKKYPLCLTLAEGGRGEESPARTEEEDDGPQRDAVVAAEPRPPVSLYLFGRTGREKEEWFQHFLSASRAKPSSGAETPGGNANLPTRLESGREPPALPVFFFFLFRSLLWRRRRQRNRRRSGRVFRRREGEDGVGLQQLHDSAG